MICLPIRQRGTRGGDESTFPARWSQRGLTTPCLTTRRSGGRTNLRMIEGKMVFDADALAFAPSMTPATNAPLYQRQLLCPTLSIIHLVDGT